MGISYYESQKNATKKLNYAIKNLKLIENSITNANSKRLAHITLEYLESDILDIDNILDCITNICSEEINAGVPDACDDYRKGAYNLAKEILDVIKQEV